METPTAPTDQPTRRIWHHVPLEQYRANDVRDHAPELMAALRPWIEAARSGLKRHGLLKYYRALERGPLDTRAAIDSELLGDITVALQNAMEWEGFTLGYELRMRDWPVDTELVQTCQRWSIATKSARIQAWRDKKGTAA